MERWTDKVALVTGASTGIGRAICEELLQKGMKVVGLALTTDKMKVRSSEFKISIFSHTSTYWNSFQN